MDMLEKLDILGSAAKYDASCSSSGSQRYNKDGIGNGHISGICHSFAADGRCISLLKILMTNCCIYDCKYCLNRRSNTVKRATLTPEEICELTINFYKRNYIEGLFLSSGVLNSPDWTMEKLIETISLLRHKYHFNGYIHAKAIPNSSPYLIDKLSSLVDRISINIEIPSEKNLRLLAPNKKGSEIMKTMQHIKENKARVGQTTQMIIGGTNDSDYQIMSLSSGMYQKFKLKRVFYSAYVSVNKDKLLPTLKNPPLVRENRLYQADWLLRFYNFKVDDLLDKDNPNFNYLLDPKCHWALRNIDKFPMEINEVSYDDLLKIPGIGVLSAKKIISTRKWTKIDFNVLKKLGVVLKRAKYFITCDGKYFVNHKEFSKSIIEGYLVNEEIKLIENKTYEQLSLFNS